MSTDLMAVPTVDDLKVRTCFICHEEDASKSANHDFVHPCRCTLVAHRKCLLRWIDSRKKTEGADYVPPRRDRCAQCRRRYVVLPAPRATITLRVMNAANDAWAIFGRCSSAIGLLFMVGSLLCAVYVGFAIYGLWVAWWMIGTSHLAWNSATFCALPAGMMVFSSLARDHRWPDSKIGYLIWLAMWIGPLNWRSLLPTILHPSWPPSYWIVASFWPFVNACYIRAKHAIQERLLDDAATRREQVHLGSSTPRSTHSVRVDNGLQWPAPDQDLQQAFTGILDSIFKDKEPGSGRSMASMIVLPPLAYLVGKFLPAVESGAVWWNSLLGLVVVVLCKDLMVLTHMLLLQRQDESRQILNLPFEDLDIPEYDLAL
ncbi:hypothetical protein EXIGLDRAFT_771732 [Exidia glandulosa HHB12029]|uniref:RING-CH-type domain-containing protein n=1 Tax=Exidia glandulosa HHB12029 TaxID=1314781 RepID=A0A165FSN1_EXIGL|nr:hypothetical protein EXIGLDRAFT_771732 [Exidia glandulosa HHB12029]